jgi:hypothetical protein
MQGRDKLRKDRTMKTTKMLAILVLALGLVVCPVKVVRTAPLGTAFTYQGRLIDANNTADGLYDFQFKLFDDPNVILGTLVGSPIDINELDVIDGYFTVDLDFGSAVFDGNAVWLEVGVRPGELADPNAYTTLEQRQAVTPTPYAIYAKTAGSDNDWMVSVNNIYSIPTGNVGIGTTTPSEKLHVVGNVKLADTSVNDAVVLKADGAGSAGQISMYDTDGTETVRIVAAETSVSGAEIKLRKADGTTSIEFDADYNGDGRIITDELEIRGGSDLSEQFDIKGAKHTVKAGMVVSIDAKRPGKLLISNEAYDNKVAGIISGAGGIKPGMMMGQKGSAADGVYPVALTGRVYCWADASTGAIQAGDLLTTSSVPGHAMKVSDHTRALGAIIGKAMTPLEKGKGLVLVLVSLQ